MHFCKLLCDIFKGVISKSAQYTYPKMIIVPLKRKGHAALDRNPGPGYNGLLLRLIPGDLFSACTHRQFHTLPAF